MARPPGRVEFIRSALALAASAKDESVRLRALELAVKLGAGSKPVHSPAPEHVEDKAA